MIARLGGHYLFDIYKDVKQIVEGIEEFTMTDTTDKDTHTRGQHQPSLQIQTSGQHKTEQLLTERIWAHTRE